MKLTEEQYLSDILEWRMRVQNLLVAKQLLIGQATNVSSMDTYKKRQYDTAAMYNEDIETSKKIDSEFKNKNK